MKDLRGNMKRIAKMFLAAMICGAVFGSGHLFAQNASETQDIQDRHENEEEVTVVYNTGNVPGDQNIKINLALTCPLSFGNPFVDGKMKLGGQASLGYHYFITPEISVGGDANFGFNVTIGANIFNYIPILATVTYTPHIKNFEFPVTLGVGFAWEMYSGRTYWPGLAIKPEIGVTYRISPSWSVGGEVSYLWLPQFNKLYNKDKENLFAQFVNLAVSARYYF